MKKRLLNDDEFNGEPMSDRQLYLMMRDNYNTDEECWEIVKEAQEAFWDLNRRLVLMEIKDERDERNRYAA